MNIDLTEEQREVVDHTTGPALVFAVAGAGKTTAMVHRIERLVRTGIFAPRSILATSFARTNVKDLKDDLGAWSHCRSVDVRTLHSLGLKIIRRAQQHGQLINFKLGDGDSGPGKIEGQILNQALGLVYKRDLGFAKELESLDRQDFLDYVGSCKSNLLYADLEAANLPPAALLKAKQAAAPTELLRWYLDLFCLFEEVRQQRGQITFDDMLVTGWDVLVRYPRVLDEIQSSYSCVLVDEFQDVNKAQSEILDLITTPHRNYMAIGDDDQTIYEWRGANPDYILRFKSRYQAKIYQIVDNFRCPAAPLVLANQVIAHNKKRQPKQLSLTRGFGGETKVYRDENASAMADRIADQVKSLQRDGHDYNDMAILIRLNAQTPYIEQKLIAAEIPYRVSNPFYERPEIRTIIDYCRLAWVDRQMAAGKGNQPALSTRQTAVECWNNISNRPKRYISGQHKDQIARALLDSRESPSQVLRNYCGQIQEDWLAESLEKLADEISRLGQNLDKPAKDTLIDLENILKYKQFLRDSSGFSQTGEARAASVAAFIDYAEGFESLLSFMQHIRELAQARAGRPKSDSKPAVTISTIHRAKGLEWPIVFIPQCNEGVLPFLSDSPGNNLEEERRLFYVALTRTRQFLFLYILRSEPTSRFLDQAQYKATLASVNRVQAILEKRTDRWQASDALFVAKTVPALNLKRYFEIWWDAAPEKQLEIAQTMLRFFVSVEQSGQFRRFRLAPSSAELWRSFAPLPALGTAPDFPGLERLQSRTQRIPDGPYNQKRVRSAGADKRLTRHSPKRTTSKNKIAQTNKRGAQKDSLNQRLKQLQNVGEGATDSEIQEFQKALEDRNPAIRYLASNQLRRIGGIRVVESLGKMLASRTIPEIRLVEIKKLLVLIGETDADPATRERARLVLGRSGEGE